jgi:hypothetical protein
MQLSQEALEAFKQIYQEEFGETLSDAEAQEMGERLLRLFQLMARPLPPRRHDSPHKKPSTS